MIRQLLFPLILLIGNIQTALLQCKRCEGALYMPGCYDTCRGDACYSLESFTDLDIQGVIKFGCISGKIPEPGCRMNQDGVVLCVCNHSHNCTEYMDVAHPRRLPISYCDRKVQSTLLPNHKWSRPCVAPYCTYDKTEFPLVENTSVSLSQGCSKQVDFDVFNSNSHFFYYPESCAKEQFGIGQQRTTCYTKDSTIDIEQVAFGEFFMECEMEYYSPYLPNLRAENLTCKGEYCAILQTAQGLIYKGCLTLNEELSGRKMAVGYFKHHNGKEQWLCDTPHCNRNLTVLENSWPSSLDQYKNMSSLRYLNRDELTSDYWIQGYLSKGAKETLGIMTFLIVAVWNL